MSRRFLLGPVDSVWAGKHIRVCENDHQVKMWDRSSSDLNNVDKWGAVESALPADWRPDVVVFIDDGGPPPQWIWHAPIPIVAVAPSPRWHWHWARRSLPKFDLILTGAANVDVFRRAGITNVSPVQWLGTESATPTGETCDIDILYLGRTNPIQNSHSASLVLPIVRLQEDWNVSFLFDSDFKDCLPMMRRAKLVALADAENLEGCICRCGAGDSAFHRADAETRTASPVFLCRRIEAEEHVKYLQDEPARLVRIETAQRHWRRPPRGVMAAN